MKGIKEEIIGKTFGYYNVISLDEERNKKEIERKNNKEIKYPSVYYWCKCECGNIKSIKKGSLINGNSTNCGCKNKKPLLNLVGNRYGKLIVQEELEDGKYYKCLCDCGNTKIVKRGCLISNGTSSCGCLIKDRYNNRENKYVIDYDKKIVIGETTRKNINFIFDLDDYNIVSKYYWRYDNGYIFSYNKNKAIKIHNLIMKFKPSTKMVVDHINRNPLDNRKENLRIITQRNNAINSSIGKNNKSGIIGVYFDKSKNQWRAVIKVNKKQISLLTDVNKRNCIIARLNGELKYFGKDFAPQRHLFKEYGIS